jgi:hypothetical protein
MEVDHRELALAYWAGLTLLPPMQDAFFAELMATHGQDASLKVCLADHAKLLLVL